MSIPQYRQDLMRIQHMVDLASLAESQTSGILSNYICIVTSGLLETVVKERLAQFTNLRADPRVTLFVEYKLEDLMNPKWDKIKQLLESFDAEWPSKIEEHIGDEGKDAIKSAVNNRNNFAHGRSGNLSLGVMKGYLSHIEKFIKALEDVVQA